MTSVRPYQQGEPVEYKSSSGTWKPATYMEDNNDGSHRIHHPHPHQDQLLKEKTRTDNLRRLDEGAEERQATTMVSEQTTEIPEAVVPRSERRAQEIMDLKNWSKGEIWSGNRTTERVFPSEDHMNLEYLLCEVGLHFLYDWEGDHTLEKRRQIIQQHMNKYPEKCTLPPPASPTMIMLSNEDFIDTVISEMSTLPQLREFYAEDGPSQEFISTTFEQFEQALPKNGLENKFLAISNCNETWAFSTKNGPAHETETMPYTLQDRLEYRIINTMLDDVDEYKWEDEESASGSEESGEEESEDSEFTFDPDGAYPMLDVNHMTDHEIEERIRGMGPQNVFVAEGTEERKGMCGKGLEILESIMDKEDQRMGEGDFVELCNLLKELHNT
jgi:hypothetical protein